MNQLQVNEKTFSIISPLGKGKGGYSYLVENKDKEKFVVKKIHHEPCSYYSFGNKFGNMIESEINDYHKLKQIGIRIPEMYDVDVSRDTILKEDRMDSIYINQIKDMCRLLYLANTNIDYFPTNFIVQNSSLYYIDYECNKLMEEWNFENWGVKYWFKTPEFLDYMRSH